MAPLSKGFPRGGDYQATTSILPVAPQAPINWKKVSDMYQNRDRLIMKKKKKKKKVC
jgi:hypothetical protein